MDLVLGAWVEENIRAMDQLHIRALMDVLDLVSLPYFCYTLCLDYSQTIVVYGIQ